MKLLNIFKKYRVVITRIFVVFILIEIFFLQEADARTPLMALLWEVSGLSLIGIATLGRLWTLMYICNNKTKNLITYGPYSVVRNPLYVFSFLGALGIGLSSEDLTITLTIIIFFVLYYPFVVLAEEEKLLETHGDKFENYKKEVPRFFPNIKLYKEKEVAEINLLKYRRYYFEVMWFIWFYMLLEIMEKIRLFF